MRPGHSAESVCCSSPRRLGAIEGLVIFRKTPPGRNSDKKQGGLRPPVPGAAAAFGCSIADQGFDDYGLPRLRRAAEETAWDREDDQELRNAARAPEKRRTTRRKAPQERRATLLCGGAAQETPGCCGSIYFAS